MRESYYWSALESEFLRLGNLTPEEQVKAYAFTRASMRLGEDWSARHSLLLRFSREIREGRDEEAPARYEGSPANAELHGVEA